MKLQEVGIKQDYRFFKAGDVVGLIKRFQNAAIVKHQNGRSGVVPVTKLNFKK